MAILTRPVFLAFALSLLTVTAAAQQSSEPGFGGPNAVENQVEADFGETWDAWKQKLKDDLGLVLSVDYTAVMLTANETFDNKDGSGGIARIFGTFDLFNIENGTLVYKFEHRHAYGSTSPFDFSLGQIGYVGLQEPPFNDTDFRTQNLYWRQRMNEGRSVLIAGSWTSPTISTRSRSRAPGCIS
jgi:porin